MLKFKKTTILILFEKKSHIMDLNWKYPRQKNHLDRLICLYWFERDFLNSVVTHNNI